MLKNSDPKLYEGLRAAFPDTWEGMSVRVNPWSFVVDGTMRDIEITFIPSAERESTRTMQRRFKDYTYNIVVSCASHDAVLAIDEGLENLFNSIPQSELTFTGGSYDLESNRWEAVYNLTGR